MLVEIKIYPHIFSKHCIPNGMLVWGGDTTVSTNILSRRDISFEVIPMVNVILIQLLSHLGNANIKFQT
jgi:hypothetical protein